MLPAEANEFFAENGYYMPVRIMSAAEARECRDHVERFERAHPEAVGKLDFKANLLFPWIDRLSRHPNVTGAVEGILGPNILCHTCQFRNKAADGKTYVSWHQDTTYLPIGPTVLSCWVALTESTVENGCLRFIPGSHKWGQLPHDERDDPDSMLTRGHYIATEFDQTAAVDAVLEPGEAALIHFGVVHSSGPNRSKDRRMGLLIDCFATSAVKHGHRDCAMLVAGVEAPEMPSFETTGPDGGIVLVNEAFGR